MSTTIPVSELPKTMQDTATMLDLNGDGAISTNDIVLAINKIKNTERKAQNLGGINTNFVMLSILLAICVFGSTIAVALLSKEVEVDHTSGFVFVKSSDHHVLMKTQEALVWKNENIVDASVEQLASIKDVVINDGDVRFVVKGSARRAGTNDVILLVEGGTLHYSDEGLVGATGNAMTLIKASLGDDYSYGDGRENERRMLRHSCSLSLWSFSVNDELSF